MSHPIHDFSGKLRQPAVVEQVRAYVEWRRAIAAARAEGAPEPPPPATAPISINLDLTTACNFRCDHCIDWDILNSKHKHEEAELRASLQLMAERGLRSVIIIGGGEPTIYPGFVEFVRYLKSLRLQVAVVSNGSRGDRLLEIADCLDEGDWIRLSLDAGSNELFIAMHRPVNPKCDLDEICSWIPKLKAKNPRVKVGFSFIIVWRGAERDGVEVQENIQEIVSATARAKHAGFDYISLKPFLERTPEGAEVMEPEHGHENLECIIKRVRIEVDKAKVHADEAFAVYESTNLRLLEEGTWEAYTHQPRVCHMQALRQVLTPTGLYNCPAHRGVGKARIGERWAFFDADNASETGGHLADLLDRFDASHECREVTCLYNDVNWWLDRMIEDPRAEGVLEAGPERADYFL